MSLGPTHLEKLHDLRRRIRKLTDGDAGRSLAIQIALNYFNADDKKLRSMLEENRGLDRRRSK